MRILDWQINNEFAKRAGTYAVIQALGAIPEFILADDPRPIHEQIAARYGEWEPMVPAEMNGGRGFKLDEKHYLHYPGDPPMPPLAHAFHGQECILVYQSAWVCVVQPDGAFQVARID